MRWAPLTRRNSPICENSGSPEDRKARGDGGSVVAIPSKETEPVIDIDIEAEISLSEEVDAKGYSVTSIVNSSRTSGLDRLKKLTLTNKTNTKHINYKVMDLVGDPYVLLAAYTAIKSNPGNMPPGADKAKETLDGIDLDNFRRLSKDLKTGKFQFRPARRLNIPKPKGGTRPLGIAPPREKIVQKAMLFVLEAIFEPTFSTHSHGIRAKRVCSSALGEIKRTFTAVN